MKPWRGIGLEAGGESPFYRGASVPVMAFVCILIGVLTSVYLILVGCCGAFVSACVLSYCLLFGLSLLFCVG